jgi:hypothetical protein
VRSLRHFVPTPLTFATKFVRAGKIGALCVVLNDDTCTRFLAQRLFIESDLRSLKHRSFEIPNRDYLADTPIEFLATD